MTINLDSVYHSSDVNFNIKDVVSCTKLNRHLCKHYLFVDKPALAQKGETYNIAIKSNKPSVTLLNLCKDFALLNKNRVFFVFNREFECIGSIVVSSILSGNDSATFKKLNNKRN